MATLNFEYVALFHSIKALLHLKILIKEVIGNLGIDSEKMKFVSSSIVGAISVATNPRMTPTQKHIAFKYHWFRQHDEK